jgi:hypothetical protein
MRALLRLEYKGRNDMGVPLSADELLGSLILSLRNIVAQ